MRKGKGRTWSMLPVFSGVRVDMYFLFFFYFFYFIFNVLFWSCYVLCCMCLFALPSHNPWTLTRQIIDDRGKFSMMLSALSYCVIYFLAILSISEALWEPAFVVLFLEKYRYVFFTKKNFSGTLQNDLTCRKTTNLKE